MQNSDDIRLLLITCSCLNLEKELIFKFLKKEKITSRYSSKSIYKIKQALKEINNYLKLINNETKLNKFSIKIIKEYYSFFQFFKKFCNYSEKLGEKNIKNNFLLNIKGIYLMQYVLLRIVNN